MSMSRAPAWLYLPLPANADPDPQWLARVEQLCSKLPDTFPQLQNALMAVRTLASYDVNLGRFRWWVDQVCQQEGFTINQEKFRVIRDSQRQVVTGIVVNDALRVPRHLRRNFRAILHNCEKNGLEAEAGKHPAFKGNAGVFRQWLRGFAAYLNMVQPETGPALLRRVDTLLGGGVEDGTPAPDQGGDGLTASPQ
jgi:hypothetical protein